MQNKVYKILKFLIGWPLSLAALFFIGKFIAPQAAELMVNITNANRQLFIYGVVSFIIFYFLRSYIWYSIIKSFNYTLSFKNSCYLWAVSELKRYIPGNIWSFLGRAVLFSEKGVSKKDIGKGLIIEAELFVLGALIVSVLSLPFVFEGFVFNSLAWFCMILVFFLILVGFVFLYPISRWEVRNVRPASHIQRLTSIIQFFLPQSSPQQNLLLLIISTVALFFFGLGNYFIIGSIVPLHPQMILELTGFFVLSFVAGYLSILTPAGFGVREGIVIYGLTKLTSLAVASFAALFSRIILILSELIFILLAYLWHQFGNFDGEVGGEKLDNEGRKGIPTSNFNIYFLISHFAHQISNLETWVSTHIHETVVLCLSLLYSLYFTTASFLRYDNFYTGRFDLGNMAQTVWNTMHGRIFLFTNPNGTETLSRLAFHADFILIFLAPFYALWSSPKMLLLIQSIVTASGAFFVYLISRHIVKNKNISLAFAFAYLMNPAVQWANLYDFHAVTLATTFLLAAYYFYLKRKYGWFLLFALLAALCKEHLWLVIALFGGLLILRQRKFVLGTSIFLFSISMFYFLIWYAIPASLGSQHFALSYYSDFGESPTSVVTSIIFSPQKIIALVFEQSRFEYLQQLFSPLGYVSLLSPLFLVFAGPDFLINLLSNNAQLHQIFYQYTATITPFVFISAIWGVWVLIWLVNHESRSMNHGLPKRFFSIIPDSLFLIQKHLGTSINIKTLINFVIIAYLLLNALSAAYQFGPLPGARQPNIDMLIKSAENKEYINNYLARIPQDYAIASSNNIGSHLSQRQEIYIVPLGIDKADLIILLLTDKWTLKADTMLVEKLKKDRRYRLVVEKDAFVVFAK